jgi:ABC-2 type transport system permease protein
VNLRILRVLLRKEYLQIYRDKLMLRQMVLMPFIQLLLLSSAATFEVKTAHVYLIDRDHSETSRGLVDRLHASGRFQIVGGSGSRELADVSLLNRSAGMILVIPVDFERDLVRTRSASVQLIFNAEDGALAAVTNSYAQQIIAAYARELTAAIRPIVNPPPQIDIRSRGWYNQELDYKDYMIPGILVQLLSLIGTMLTAMNIVRE